METLCKPWTPSAPIPLKVRGLSTPVGGTEEEAPPYLGVRSGFVEGAAEGSLRVSGSGVCGVCG